MKIFNVNRRCTISGEVLESANLNLQSSEIQTIVSSLEKFKTEDVVMASCKNTILDYFKPLIK